MAQHCWQGNWICLIAGVSVRLTNAGCNDANQHLASGWRRQMQRFDREWPAFCADDSRFDLLSASVNFTTLLSGNPGIHETSSFVADWDFNGGSAAICLLGACSKRANAARSIHRRKSPSAATINGSLDQTRAFREKNVKAKNVYKNRAEHEQTQRSCARNGDEDAASDFQHLHKSKIVARNHRAQKHCGR